MKTHKIVLILAVLACLFALSAMQGCATSAQVDATFKAYDTNRLDQALKLDKAYTEKQNAIARATVLLYGGQMTPASYQTYVESLSPATAAVAGTPVPAPPMPAPPISGGLDLLQTILAALGASIPVAGAAAVALNAYRNGTSPQRISDNIAKINTGEVQVAPPPGSAIAAPSQPVAPSIAGAGGLRAPLGSPVP